jgi:hypothetical protein
MATARRPITLATRDTPPTRDTPDIQATPGTPAAASLNRTRSRPGR